MEQLLFTGHFRPAIGNHGSDQRYFRVVQLLLMNVNSTWIWFAKDKSNHGKYSESTSNFLSFKTLVCPLIGKKEHIVNNEQSLSASTRVSSKKMMHDLVSHYFGVCYIPVRVSNSITEVVHWSIYVHPSNIAISENDVIVFTQGNDIFYVNNESKKVKLFSIATSDIQAIHATIKGTLLVGYRAGIMIFDMEGILLIVSL